MVGRGREPYGPCAAATTLGRVATLADVAREAGVSVSVASRVLTGDPSLRAREETRLRVRTAAATLAYTPNHSARALRLARSGTIGLLVPDLSSAIAAGIVSGVEAATVRSGLQVLLGRAEWLGEDGAFVGRLLDEGRIDGLLLQLPDRASSELAEALLGLSAPVVCLNRRVSVPGSVVLDDEAAGRVATAHLADLGHTDIGFLGGVPQSWTSPARRRGVEAELVRRGLAVRPEWFTAAGYSTQDGRTGVRELLSRRERPTGVVVANVNAALGALAAARESGFDLPRDLSLVAVHDSDVAELLTPPLTTVRMPLEELGATGLRRLAERMDGQPAVDATVVDPPPQLLVRGSTAPPRG